MTTTKKCPYCSEEIKSEAIICKHCQKNLGTPEAKQMFIKKEAELEKRMKEESTKRKVEEDRNVRYGKMVFIWTGTGAILLLLFNSHPIIAFIAVFLTIWLQPGENEPILQNRFKNYKKQMYRIIASSIALIILFPFIVSNVSDTLKERTRGKQIAINRKEYREEIDMIANFPEPQIEILTSKEHQGQATEYLLEFTVSDADEVFLNSNKVEVLGQKYSYTIPLDNITTRIKVSAKNEHKDSSSSFDITRDETAEEEKIRLEEEAEARAEAERIKAEKERAKKEREEKAKAEQLAWERSKAGKLCAKYPTWSKDECRMIADKKHYVDWIGMTYDMLVELRGRPNSANPSDYGYGKQWQWCWYYYTPSCFYDDNDDGIIDSYN